MRGDRAWGSCVGVVRGSCCAAHCPRCPMRSSPQVEGRKEIEKRIADRKKVRSDYDAYRRKQMHQMQTDPANSRQYEANLEHARQTYAWLARLCNHLPTDPSLLASHHTRASSPVGIGVCASPQLREALCHGRVRFSGRCARARYGPRRGVHGRSRRSGCFPREVRAVPSPSPSWPPAVSHAVGRGLACTFAQDARRPPRAMRWSRPASRGLVRSVNTRLGEYVKAQAVAFDGSAALKTSWNNVSLQLRSFQANPKPPPPRAARASRGDGAPAKSAGPASSGAAAPGKRTGAEYSPPDLTEAPSAAHAAAARPPAPTQPQAPRPAAPPARTAPVAAEVDLLGGFAATPTPSNGGTRSGSGTPQSSPPPAPAPEVDLLGGGGFQAPPAAAPTPAASAFDAGFADDPFAAFGDDCGSGAGSTAGSAGNSGSASIDLMGGNGGSGGSALDLMMGGSSGGGGGARMGNSTPPYATPNLHPPPPTSTQPPSYLHPTPHRHPSAPSLHSSIGPNGARTAPRGFTPLTRVTHVRATTLVNKQEALLWMTCCSSSAPPRL